MLAPAQGHTVEENQRALEDLLQRFKSTPPDPQSLARAKAQGRANLVRRMASNSDLARLLAFVSANYGDWRKLFTTLDDLDQVKAEDVQRAANRYFVATGRTTVSTVLPGQSSAPPSTGAQDRRSAMKIFLGILLLAAAARAQVGGIPGSGRGGTQPLLPRPHPPPPHAAGSLQQRRPLPALLRPRTSSTRRCAPSRRPMPPPSRCQTA